MVVDRADEGARARVVVGYIQNDVSALRSKRDRLVYVRYLCMSRITHVYVPVSTQKASHHIPSESSFTSSMVMFRSSPAKSLSSVRNSMQWHSLRSRIGTHGQFQNPLCTSASLSS